ncbi:hypothetical protein JCM24511_10055 [Saitozyma sp. JCM 24511]|nr:hypothetical protein JCM24511_10055 [Saitozyma sp. JCM 24511]
MTEAQASHSAGPVSCVASSSASGSGSGSGIGTPAPETLSFSLSEAVDVDAGLAEAEAERAVQVQVQVQRSRTGCLTCRRRKVKCDERPPTCGKCQIKKRECIWPPAGSDSTNRKRKRRTTGPVDLTDLSPSTPTHLPTATAPFSISPPASASLFARHNRTLAAGVPHGIANADVVSIPDPVPIALFSVPPAAPPAAPPPVAPTSKVPPAEDDLTAILLPDALRLSLMMDPTYLKPFFTTMDEQLVMRHYLSRTVKIILAFDSSHRPWNPWVAVHAPLAFRHPPGVSYANDALRTAMLAVGGVHLQYCHNPKNQSAALRITRLAKQRVLHLVNLTLRDTDGRDRVVDQSETELVMAALLSCTIASSLAADDSWHELLTTVLALIDRLGGAQDLLEHSPRNRISPCRFILEQLAIRDVFGCMTTELAPSILRDAFTPWFFEAEGWSRAGVEWESVERMFGISRGMVDLIARVCTLISKVRQGGHSIIRMIEQGQGEVASQTLPRVISQDGFAVQLPSHIAARLVPSAAAIQNTVTNRTTPVRSTLAPTQTGSGTHTKSSSNPGASPQLVELEHEANRLIREIGVWDQAANFTPFHPRTQYGNHSYRHAIKIRLLREVFRVPASDNRVKESVSAILELAKELLALYGRITWMTWPILIAGFEIPKDDQTRKTAVDLLGEFEPHACFDNGAASRMLRQLWELRDKDENVTPAQAARQLGSRPFLD